MERVRGRAFFFGDNVDTDQILPGYAMSYPVEKLGSAAMCGSDLPDFPLVAGKGDMIIAGENFGCGSSREQAPTALKECGVGAVVAGSFARIFKRNAINIGLPVIVSPDVMSIRREAGDGDIFVLDLAGGLLANETKGKSYKLVSIPRSSLEILAAGGLINRVRAKLAERGEAEGQHLFLSEKEAKVR